MVGMIHCRPLILLIGTAVCVGGGPGVVSAPLSTTEALTRAPQPSNRDAVDYSRAIQPLLAAQCYQCHGPDAEARKAGLRLDDRAALLAFVNKDGTHALVPGSPDTSELVRRVETHDDEERMPRNAGKRLSEDEIALVRRWISEGAPFTTFWAFVQPVANPLPAVQDASWVSNEIDAFVLSTLEAKGLRPAPRSDRRTLLRRLSFDLTGLPPTPKELADFLADPAPENNAWTHQVDRLLASPAFGEKWASHWLDLAHYAETYGHEFDFEMQAPWHYRDYVVRAFNADVSYDQFLREQLAGDLLANPRRDPVSGANESVLGTAFLRLGEDMHSPVDVLTHQSDRVDNQIDTVGKTFQGLTIACARCHDHKFDPITQRDYTALYGVLASSRYALVPCDETPERERRLAAARAAKVALFSPEVAAESPVVPTPAGSIPLPGSAQPAGWHSIGLPLSDLVAVAGARAPGATMDHPVARQWNKEGVDTAMLGRQVEVQLRSPTFMIRQRYLHVRAAGEGARINLCVEGFKMIRDPLYGGLHRRLDHADPHWITFDLERWKPDGGVVQGAWLEFLDLVPPDPAQVAPADPAGNWRFDAWFALDAVLMSDDPKPPTLGMPWSVPQVSCTPESWATFAAASAALGGRTWCLGTADGTGRDYPVFLHGSAHRPGPVVPRGFLATWGGRPFQTEGSGRLALAESMLQPSNPLTARVMVNRLWHHLFGRGLVASTDNFGVLGDRPTHPELLDFLAVRFSGPDHWRMKTMIRRIVCSSAYRMASWSTDTHAEVADPSNLLLHRQNLRRLPAESVRDAILAAAGQLKADLGGPSVQVWLDPDVGGRGRPTLSGPLDGAGRRTLYLAVRRNFPLGFLAAFDRPQPSFTVGRRPATNVPAQSLSMMNDPLVHAMAGALAMDILHASTDPAARLTMLFERTLSRPPSTAEAEAMRLFLEKRMAAGDDEVVAWTSLAHAAFQLKEFIFLS